MERICGIGSCVPQGDDMANDTVKWRQIKFLVYPVFVVLGVYIILYLYCGEIFTHSPYNSYTKQCIAWLNGRLDLGQNYSWLELAIYNGKYYVSFPPFPSYVLLPFAYFLGENTPESLINLLVALIGVAYSSLTVLEYKWNEWYAVLLPIFLYVGGAVLPLPLSIGVWFVAQNMSFTLTLMSIYYAKKGRKGLSLFLLCCASGCRPFQVVYMPLIIYIYTHHSQSTVIRLKTYLLKKMVVFTPTVLLAASYLLLNYLRFGNPMEFGHNYLPEFTNSENGQFHPSYMLQNLYNLIRLPDFSPETKMSIPQFNGMNIIICFPILVWWLYVVVTSKSPTVIDLSVLCCVILHILMLVSHKTMGGYHYGNRYIADTMPAVFTAICSSKINLKYRDFLFLQLLLLLGLAFNGIGYSQFLQGTA